MKNEQTRFYDVAEKFDDDERLMAFAIVKVLKSEKSVEVVWRELLACEWDEYLTTLESLTLDEIEILKKKAKAQLKGVFQKGDFGMIQDRGWKLHLPPKVKKKKKKRKIKRKKKKTKGQQMTIFDFLGDE